MIPSKALLLFAATAIAAPAPGKPSREDLCAWRALFPYLPCIGDLTLKHGNNGTTSPSRCYQSSRTGDCAYCGKADNGTTNALLNAETGKVDTLCADGGYCDFNVNSDLSCQGD